MKQFIENKFAYTFNKANKENAQVILFIHGFATNSDYHDLAIPYLSEYDYYAIELPGHNIAPKQTNEKNTFARFIDYIIEFIEYKDFNNFILIGHSMGGGLATCVSTRVPERISKSIFITPFNTQITLNSINIFKFFPNNLDQAFKHQSLIYKYPRDFFPTNDCDKLKSILKYQLDNRKEFRKLSWNLMSISTLNLVNNALKHLTDKSFLITGENDRIINSKATLRLYKKYIPAINCYEIKDASHLPFIEKTNEYINIIKTIIASN